MKSFNKKVIIVTFLVIISLAGLGLLTYAILHDQDKLTVEEKEWLTKNQNVVQSIHVVNNIDVFGKTFLSMVSPSNPTFVYFASDAPFTAI